MIFDEQLPDEAIWYCLSRENARQQAACAKAASFLLGESPAAFAASCPVQARPEGQRSPLLSHRVAGACH